VDHSAEIVRATSSFDAFVHRDETRELGTLVRPRRGRGTTARARRTATVVIFAGLAVAVIVALSLIGGLVGGLAGSLPGLLFLLTAAMLLLALFGVGFWPKARVRPIAAYKEEMPNRAVVQRLRQMLDRHRLPAAAAPKVAAIQAKLPLLESRLADLNPLDPLAQEARRLMGQHLPDLITHYERVPAQYRREQDGDGKSVDQRLVAGLDAAHHAIDDLSRQLARQDVDAFETQGRFLESRYRDEGPGAIG
jgi:hypothetical protein